MARGTEKKDTITAREVVAYLKSDLSNEERQILTTLLLEKLGALPLHAMIATDPSGQFFINGKQVTMDTAKRLRETSKTMLTNFARRFVREQVVYMAIMKGVHENVSPEQGLFAKAALWFYQEEDELYRQFAGTDADEEAHTL